MSNKFEQLLDLLVNEEKDKAEALLSDLELRIRSSRKSSKSSKRIARTIVSKRNLQNRASLSLRDRVREGSFQNPLEVRISQVTLTKSWDCNYQKLRIYGISESKS